MDESCERSDTETEGRRGGEFLKYSGRKGSDKFQRRVSSSGSTSRFHFRRRNPRRSPSTGNLPARRLIMADPRLVRTIINNYRRSLSRFRTYL